MPTTFVDAFLELWICAALLGVLRKFNDAQSGKKGIQSTIWVWVHVVWAHLVCRLPMSQVLHLLHICVFCMLLLTQKTPAGGGGGSVGLGLDILGGVLGQRYEFRCEGPEIFGSTFRRPFLGVPPVRGGPCARLGGTPRRVKKKLGRLSQGRGSGMQNHIESCMCVCLPSITVLPQ